MDIVELLIGIAEIATALAGFTGVVVAFGSRSQGSWHPGDRLRLVFLLEASLTAAGFSLLALLAIASLGNEPLPWRLLSALWFIYTGFSLWSSHRRIRTNLHEHHDVDQLANRVTFTLFLSVMALQALNVVLWQAFPAFLAALILNLAGAAMQFARLIRSAFRN
ncbi:MAG: hypothetical protein ACR2PZ_11585 [Pseudomonadales bacterium]